MRSASRMDWSVSALAGYGVGKPWQNKNREETMIRRPDDTLGQFVSQFVAERIETPLPDKIDIWTKLVCGDLFSVAFVCWLPSVKTYSARQQMDTGSNSLINEIANHANVWINIKFKQVFGNHNKLAQIEIDQTGFVRAHLGAMFQEAITGMAEKNFDPEVARAHAYFVVLSKELEHLVLKNVLPLSAVRDVLTQGLSTADKMANEVRLAISGRQV